jgi:U3 small nucleolar RNA-associated protein 23
MEQRSRRKYLRVFTVMGDGIIRAVKQHRKYTEIDEKHCYRQALFASLMRHLRAKQGRKTLNYFRIHFGISAPFSVILDGNFIHLATSHKIDIKGRISKHLQGEKFTLFVPLCVLAELEAIGAPVVAALEFARVHCETIRDPASNTMTPTDAIKKIVGTSNLLKYIIATQEDDLRSHLRSIAGVPLLHIQRTILLLEGPSTSSRNQGSRVEAAKLTDFSVVEQEEMRLAKKLRLLERAEKRRADGAASTIIPRKLKAKGPNPLSCMRKKDSVVAPRGDTEKSSVQAEKIRKVRRKQKSKSLEEASSIVV